MFVDSADRAQDHKTVNIIAKRSTIQCDCNIDATPGWQENRIVRALYYRRQEWREKKQSVGQPN
jgi:hypothetical protein